MAQDSSGQIVKDVGRWEWSELIKKEDWWAVWLGFFLLVAGMFIYFPHAGDMNAKLQKIEAEHMQQANRTEAFKTIAWYKMYDAKKKVKVNSVPAGKWLKKFSSKPKKWKSNPLDALYRSK